MVWCIQTASQQDFTGLCKLAGEIRKTGERIDWEGPYKYEYSTALWYLRRLRTHESLSKRKALMEITGERGKPQGPDRANPVL